MSTVVEPCNACGRFVRRGASRCPFCQVALVARPAPRRSLGRTRLALAGGAALLLAACGDPEPDVESDTSGGEQLGDDAQAPNGEVVGDGDVHEEEVSCAGRCGSHHHPPCMDDPDPCPAPPYGAPPVDVWV